ncbi:hypothetical protein E2562_002658 [Oryza meyeriana var. granulata]|uniref:Uncharacterized protein n=1 Tax=Oryza meyeriana var. granulata TaxID=110450 RepID=A0A6G1BQJ2_9ORYZ|nr:hypothetical protein E2562_002658 [Oryza meyeriana var. granulata]
MTATRAPGMGATNAVGSLGTEDGSRRHRLKPGHRGRRSGACYRRELGWVATWSSGARESATATSWSTGG